MWKSLEMDSPKFRKTVSDSQRTMRTLLQDLAQKSLKGLGTKACTNWEDRSANSLAYQVSNHGTFLYAGCLSLQNSHLMRAILEDFKGYSSALELAIDASTSDTFCQNMQSEMCFTSKTPLLLLIIVVHNLQSMTSGLPLPSWRAHKMLHGDAWPLADLNQSVLCFIFYSETNSITTSLSSSTFVSVNISASFQYRAKRQAWYFPNGRRYDRNKTLCLVGKRNWKLGWISQFDLASTCTHCMTNLKRPYVKCESGSTL